MNNTMDDKLQEILNFSKEKDITLDQAISIFQLESIDKRIEANKSYMISQDDINANAADFVNNIYKSFEGYIIESIEQIKNYYAKILISTALTKGQIAEVLERIKKHLPLCCVAKVTHLQKAVDSDSDYSTLFHIHKVTINRKEDDETMMISLKLSASHLLFDDIEDKIGHTELSLIDKELEAQRELQRNAPLFTKEEMVHIIESINTKGYLICDIEENNIKIPARKLARLKNSEIEKAAKEYNLTTTIDRRKRISIFDIVYKKKTYYIMADTEKNDWNNCENILKETLKGLSV